MRDISQHCYSLHICSAFSYTLLRLEVIEIKVDTLFARSQDLFTESSQDLNNKSSSNQKIRLIAFQIYSSKSA